MKPYSSGKRKAPSTNQRHFFENPNRYDEHEQLLHPSLQRQGSTTTHMSIPSLTRSTTVHPNPPSVHPYSQYNGYGSTNNSGMNPSNGVGNAQPTKQYSINNSHHHHGNGSHPIHASVMPGTTPPQLFTSPSFFTDR